MLKDKILQLITEYVARQQLIYEAITDLRPYMFLIDDKNASNEHLIAVTLKYKDVPNRGIWKKYGTWEYYIHGNGCRLTNLMSKEQIEWDVAQLNYFYVPWFLNWFDWVRKINGVYSDIANDTLYDLLDELQMDGHIDRIYPENKQKLRLIRK